MEDFDELMRIQKQMATRIIEESNEDLNISLMDIAESVMGKKRRVQVEAIILEAEKQGISSEDTLSTIDQLVDLGFFKLPEEGFIERV